VWGWDHSHLRLFSGGIRNLKTTPWWISRGPFWTIHHNSQDFGNKILVAFIIERCLTFLLHLWHLPKDWTHPRARVSPSYSHHPYHSFYIVGNKFCRLGKPSYSLKKEPHIFSYHKLCREVGKGQGFHKQHNNYNYPISLWAHHHQIRLPFGIDQQPRGPLHQWNYLNFNYEIYDKPQEGHNLLPPREWLSREHQQGVGGYFKEDNQLQLHKLGCKIANCLMRLSKLLQD
jgi:hypothetical protein